MHKHILVLFTTLLSVTQAIEWMGAFEKEEEHSHGGSHEEEEPLFLYFQKSTTTGTWAEGQMKVLFLPSVEAECSDHSIHDTETEAEAVFAADSYTNVTHGATLSNGTLYNLQFDDEEHLFVSIFELDLDFDHFVMFAEHFPMEFEGGEQHFLKDAEGHDIEPCATEPSSSSHSDGLHGSELASTVFGATLLTSLCSLIGVLTLAPLIKKLVQDNMGALQGFASGAILAAAFFLMLFEGNHLMFKVGDESDQAAVYGVTVISGVLTGFIVKIFTIRCVGASHTHGTDIVPSGGDVEMASTTSTTKGSTKMAKNKDMDENISLCDFSRSTPIAWAVFWVRIS